MNRLPSELLLHTFELATAIPNLPLSPALSSSPSPSPTSSCPSSGYSSPTTHQYATPRHAPTPSIYSPPDPFTCPNSSFPPFAVSPDNYGDTQDLLESIRTSRALIRVCKRWYGLAIPSLYRALPIFVNGQSEDKIDMSRLTQLRNTIVHSASEAAQNGGQKHLGHHTRYLLFASLPPYESCRPHIPTIRTLTCTILSLLPNLSIFSYRSRSTIITPMIPVLLETSGRTGKLRMVHSVEAASWREEVGGRGVGWGLYEEGGGGCEGMGAWVVGSRGEGDGRARKAGSSEGGIGGGGKQRLRLCPGELLRWRRLTFARVTLSASCDVCRASPSTSLSSHRDHDHANQNPDPPHLDLSSTSFSPNPNLTQILLLTSRLNIPSAGPFMDSGYHPTSYPNDVEGSSLACVTSDCTRRFFEVQGRYLRTVYVDLDYFGGEAVEEVLRLVVRYREGCSDVSTSSSAASSPSIADSGVSFNTHTPWDEHDNGEVSEGVKVVILMNRWSQFPANLHIPEGITALGFYARSPRLSHPWHVSRALKSACIDLPSSECADEDHDVGRGWGRARGRGGLEVIRFFNEERMGDVKAVCGRAFGGELRVEDVDEWGA